MNESSLVLAPAILLTIVITIMKFGWQGRLASMMDPLQALRYE
jgi:uncharacterized protein (DUF486 family)